LFNIKLLFYFQAKNIHELQKAQSEQGGRLAQEVDRIHQEVMKENKLR
jgi:HD superfamily phosphodiesterase